MNILIVYSGNAESDNLEKDHAYIYDQVEAIKSLHPEISFMFLPVKGKGVWGYLKNIFTVGASIKRFNPDIVHAHGGHIGFLCVFQRKIPVVTTFHGSDINFLSTRIFSAITSIFSSYCIYVSDNLMKKAFIRGNRSEIMPCGVDLDKFYPIGKFEAKEKLGISNSEKYILFAGSFGRRVKNASLAIEAMKEFSGISLFELKNRNRQEVNLLLNGADLLLLTSFKEGSPQVIKEALACNCPIVSVKVGDIEKNASHIPGTFLCNNFLVEEIRENIRKALDYGIRTNGRAYIKHFDNKIIGERIYKIYKGI